MKWCWFFLIYPLLLEASTQVVIQGPSEGPLSITVRADQLFQEWPFYPPEEFASSPRLHALRPTPPAQFKSVKKRIALIIGRGANKMSFTHRWPPLGSAPDAYVIRLTEKHALINPQLYYALPGEAPARVNVASSVAGGQARLLLPDLIESAASATTQSWERPFFIFFGPHTYRKYQGVHFIWPEGITPETQRQLRTEIPGLLGTFQELLPPLASTEIMVVPYPVPQKQHNPFLGFYSQGVILLKIFSQGAQTPEDLRRTLAHELAHHMTVSQWGPQGMRAQDQWIIEGLATFLELIGAPGASSDRLVFKKQLNLSLRSCQQALIRHHHLRAGASLDEQRMAFDCGAVFFGLLYLKLGARNFRAFMGEFNQAQRNAGHFAFALELFKGRAKLDLAPFMEGRVGLKEWQNLFRQAGLKGQVEDPLARMKAGEQVFYLLSQMMGHNCQQVGLQLIRPSPGSEAFYLSIPPGLCPGLKATDIARVMELNLWEGPSVLASKIPERCQNDGHLRLESSQGERFQWRCDGALTESKLWVLD